jgi:hypothetical protein
MAALPVLLSSLFEVELGVALRPPFSETGGTLNPSETTVDFLIPFASLYVISISSFAASRRPHWTGTRSCYLCRLIDWDGPDVKCSSSEAYCRSERRLSVWQLLLLVRLLVDRSIAGAAIIVVVVVTATTSSGLCELFVIMLPPIALIVTMTLLASAEPLFLMSNLISLASPEARLSYHCANGNHNYIVFPLSQ